MIAPLLVPIPLPQCGRGQGEGEISTLFSTSRIISRGITTSTSPPHASSIAQDRWMAEDRRYVQPACGGSRMSIMRSALAAAISVGLLSQPIAAAAQQTGKVVRIGLLDYGASDPATAPRWAALREQLRELGYVEGQNTVFLSRKGDGQVSRLRGLVAELIEAKVDILVTAGSEAAIAARQVTSSIPIVTATGSDPVEAGLATSLARPGGNVTGVISLIGPLTSKRLELLKQMLPRA